MSESHYSYDEHGEVWPYFALTMVSVVLVPVTVTQLSRSLSSSKAGSELSHKRAGSVANETQLASFRAKHSQKSSKVWLWIVAGWATVAGLVYLIILDREAQAAATADRKPFDPYEILGVSVDATAKEIKSSFRKLSKFLHPDKIRDFVNTTREEAEERYVEIVKAHRALTDDETRENFLKYGHPDGPQQTSHGIALPRFLVDGKGSPLVIAFYSVFVGVVLPWFVGSWWSKSRAYTKAGIHQDTAARYFEVCAKEQPHFITNDTILTLLSESQEFSLLLPSRTPAEIKQLLIDYLDRKKLASAADENDKYVVALRSVTLLEGLLDIASGFKSTLLCQRIIEFKRCIIQAVPLKSQSRGQILQGYAGSPEDEVKLDTVKDSLSQIPKLHFIKAYFKVPGDKIVPPRAQAHLIVKFAVVPLGSKPASAEDFDPVLVGNSLPAGTLVDEDDEEDPEVSKVLREPLSTNELPPALPNAIAPYFPGLNKPVWYGFITNERDGKIVDGPIEMTKLDLSNLTLSEEEIADGSKLTVGMFKIQLTTATPPFPGQFSFKLMLLSSAYHGCDIVETVQMTVENPPVAPEPEKAEADDEDDYGISDPEEDSIAGALAQMRGGRVKKSAVRKALDGESDESEIDDDDDLTDIDTDTEVEDDDEEEEEEPKKEK